MHNELNVEVLKEFNKFGLIVSLSPGTFEIPFSIKPDEFLHYAECNLNENTPHGLLDCLSNTKRAIECQIDSLLMYLCLYSMAKKKNLGFPAKIEILNDMGILSPRILTKINKTRNLLEHSYQIPDKEKVEDALDIAYLFIQNTGRYLNFATSSFDLECDCRSLDDIDRNVYTDQGNPTYGGFYDIKLDRDSKIFIIKPHIRNWKTNETLPYSTTKIEFGSDEFNECLRMFIKLHDLISIR
ncbi:hypothetical protein RE474_13690 [Methanolobus sediminis]|uniref:Uncharacterized protein n=1 Tax=Methanolobus sediminis TaxID=3072978 RepID=A0AA51UKA3_9EURY|nr:hypothetical protein [Methanolobus sediminis]WMW25116.1 hypothetical protein RE474_13690 [Methanolobus sediminis]